MQSQTRRELRDRWAKGLPDSIQSFRFPDHLRSMRWPDTRALWRLYAGRTPSDRDPGADHNTDPEPCDCSEGFISSAQIFLECRLFLRPRSRMIPKALEIAISSILRATHTPAVLEFMKTTGLGYTRNLHADSEADKNEEGKEGEEGEGGGREHGTERRESGSGGVEDEDVGGVGEGSEEADEWRFGMFE
jgi:hypothetical protein